MALETEIQTIKGLLACRQRTEAIVASLAEIETDNPEIQGDLRTARGLARGLQETLLKLDIDCNGLRYSKPASAQMTIQEVLSAARRGEPELNGDEESRIAGAAADVGDPTHLEVLDLLDKAQPTRGWTLGAVLPMTPEERKNAARWAITKDGPPPPEVSRKMLEDLLLMDSDPDLILLLSWVDIHVVSVGWQEDVRGWVAEWASLAHRHDRGETDLPAIPDLPDVLEPGDSAFQEVLDVLAASDVGCTRPTVVQRMEGSCPAVLYVFDALVESGYVQLADRQHYMNNVDSVSSDEIATLRGVVLNLARRLPAGDESEPVEEPELAEEEAEAEYQDIPA